MPHRIGCLLLAGLAAGAVPAHAQGPAAPRPPAQAAPDPAFEAARIAFEALPEAERKGLQDALVWTGDYNSVVTGTFGRRSFEGLNAYRARTGGGDPLTPAGRAAILAAGEAARKAARFAVKPDPASGVVLGVPERLLSRRSPLPGPVPAGTRWQSADGRATLETRAFPPGTADLDALFERATAPLPERKVTYKLKRPDFVVVTAETATGRSYIRYAAGPGGVRGFTVGYDRALAAEIDRLVIAVANSFVPFPEAGAPVAAAPPASAPAQPLAAPRITPAAAAAPAATGIVVGPNRVLTAASSVEGCTPRVAGKPARLLRSDPAVGLALIEVAGVAAPVALAVRTEPGADLIVLAAGAEGVTVAPASTEAGRLTAPLQPGASGAPAFDRTGHLAGLVARYPTAPLRVAGVVPPLTFPMVPAQQVAAFLGANGVVTGDRGAGGPSGFGAVAGAVRGAIVGVACAP